MPICSIYNTYGNVLTTFNTSEIGRTIKIGRSAECEVPIHTDNTVSREQLIMKKNGNEWTLENIGHAIMYKNGSSVQEPVVLQIGDIFRFSCYFLCIGEKTGPSKYELTWNFDTENNQKRAVLWPGVNVVGASKDNEVTIRNSDLSRHHGRITVNGNHIFYEKAHTACRATINGQPLGSKKQMEITPQDEIVLAMDCPIVLQENTRKAVTKIQGVGNQNVPSKSKPVAGAIVVLIALLMLTLLVLVIASGLGFIEM